MFLFLPFSAFLSSVLLLKRKINGCLWRESILYSFLGFGTLVLLSTEFLSIFKLFSLGPLSVFWGSVTAALLFFNVTGKRAFKPSIEIPSLTRLPLLDKYLAGFIFLLIVILGLIAITTPPNTWDAMTYHMGRVAHWVQNRTVAFYPTNIERQLYINPFAEYWIAQCVILLHGSDLFVNMVQWMSMLGTLTGVSLIAKALGLNRSGQILSAFFVITLPNAIVQSSSAQTDFVVTLWIVTAVYFMLKNVQALSLINTLAVLAAFILAFYTKGSCLFILLPFWIWMLCANLKKRGWRQSALVLIGLALVMGFYLWRNNFWLGSSVFPEEHNHELHIGDLKGIFSNLLLHYGMHLRTGFLVTDLALGDFIEKIHQWMGMSILSSPANIHALPFNFMEFPFQEDEVPNFIFFVTLLACGAWYLLFKRHEFSSFKGKFTLLAFLCFFVFNAFVKWSPFDGRYHLPFFVLFAPFLADIFAGARKTLFVIIIFFSLSAAVFVFYNQSKPLAGGSSLLSTPREFKYFYTNPGALPSTASITQGVAQSNCHEVGLELGENAWEYPFWAFLKNRVTPLRIEHVLVKNSSRDLPYPLGSFTPCLIISVQSVRSIDYSGNTYFMAGSVGGLSLYYFIKSSP
jgi:hypothetical protein